MPWQFDRACFAKNSARTYEESSRLKLFFVFLIDAVVAVILLRTIFSTANRIQACSPQNFQPFVPGPLRPVNAAVRESTRKRRDHEV